MIPQGSHLTQQPTPNNPKTQPRRKKAPRLRKVPEVGPTNEPRSPPRFYIGPRRWTKQPRNPVALWTPKKAEYIG